MAALAGEAVAALVASAEAPGPTAPKAFGVVVALEVATSRAGGFTPPSGSQRRNQGGFGGAPTGRGGATSTPFAVAASVGAAGLVAAGGAGGLLNASTPSAALQKALASHASRYTWIAATVGSNAASGYQLATNDPVMAIGGFNGTDPAPTLAQFKAFVKAGKIHYFISGGTGASSASDAGAITSWVESHFTAPPLAVPPSTT